jgi:hypothetical protein
VLSEHSVTWRIVVAWVDSVGLKQILQQAEGGDEIRAVLQAAVTRVQVRGCPIALAGCEEGEIIYCKCHMYLKKNDLPL